MKEIIFYHPYDLVDKPRKGSEVRPKNMKEAFENIGFKVRLVTGNSLKRKRAIKTIKKEIKRGKTFEFLYGESSNMPIPLADSHHFPIRPLQDFLFFKFLNKHSVPIGFFYRDIFWQFKELRKRENFLKNIPRLLFHWIEWFGLKHTVDHLFIPSERMAHYLPTSLSDQKWSALYPGCSPIESDREEVVSNNDENLKLFYIGGIEPTLYNVEPLLEVVADVEGVTLMLCCREKEWTKYSSYYRTFDLSDVEIVHADSSEIGVFYKGADLVMCLWPSEGYINITMPIKIIESLGYEVPLILLEGSESADLVKKEQAGWVVDSIDKAKKLLLQLKTDRSEIERKKNKIRKINDKHSWIRRAAKASEILGPLR